jgi:DNA-binding MurR/RpiR family transcriptional regulator
MSVNFGKKVNAIAIGKRQIQQNQIKAPISEAGKSVFAAAGGFHRVAFQFQQRLQRFADCRFVINDQHCTQRRSVAFAWMAQYNCGFRH